MIHVPRFPHALVPVGIVAIVVPLLLMISCGGPPGPGEEPGVSSVEQAILVGDWETVYRKFRSSADEDCGPITRALMSRARLMTNHGGTGHYRLFTEADRLAWSDWAATFHQLHPENAVAAYLYGDALARLHRAEEAIRAYTGALEQDSTLVLAYNARAVAYSMNPESLDRAFDDFSIALGLKSDFAAAYYNRGLTYQDMGEYEAAMIDLEAAVKADSTFHVALSALGRAYMQQEEYRHAIDRFSAYMTKAGDEADVFCLRGRCYCILGEYDKGIQDYHLALGADSAYVRAFLYLGDAYVELGDFDLAVAEYSRAIRSAPDHAAGYAGRGVAYQLQGRLGQAADDLEHAIEVDPDYPQAHSGLGDLYLSVLDSEKAVLHYSRALDHPEAFQDLFQLYHNRGLAFDLLGRHAEAVKDFNQALALNETSVPALCNRGGALLSMSELERALADFSRAVRLDPVNADAHYGLAMVYEELGQYREAADAYLKFIDLAPEDSAYLIELARERVRELEWQLDSR
jgi:tetratricopeptide (TPR) repeat protein